MDNPTAQPTPDSEIQDQVQESSDIAQTPSELKGEIATAPYETAPIAGSVSAGQSAPEQHSAPKTRGAARYALPLGGLAVLAVVGTYALVKSSRPTTPVKGNSGQSGVKPGVAPTSPGSDGQNGSGQANTSKADSDTPFNTPLLGLTPQPSLGLTPKSSLTGSPAKGAPTLPPQSPAARLFAQAVELQKVGKIAEATQAYRKVTTLQPQAAAAWINLSILLLQSKQPAQAVAPLRRATQLEPKNSALQQQLVRTLLSLKRPKEALAPLQELARMQPKDLATQTMLAQLFAQNGKPREAYGQWVKLVSLDPQNPVPPFFAGLLAAQVLRQPEAGEKYLRLAFDLQRRPGQKVTDVRAPLFLAQLLLARNKATEAAQVCEAGIKQFPQVVELRTQLADTRIRLKDVPGAVQATRDAIRILPASAPSELKAQLHAGLARMLLSLDQAKEGLAELRTASQLVPQNQKLATYLKTVEAQIKAAPAQPALSNANATLRQKARALGRAEKWNDAAKAYAAYNAAQKGDASGLTEYAFVQEQRKDWKSAEQLWGQVATLQPKSPVPPFRRSEALRRLNRQPEALTMIRRAYALAPTDPAVLIATADAEAFGKNFSVARERMQQLLALQPNFAQGYMALVDVAERGKDLPPAVEFLKKQIAKHPNHSEAYEAILAAYDDMGQAKQGRDWVKGWVERDKKNKAARTALDNYDLFKARQELQAGLQRDRERLKNQRPAATEAPKAPDAAAPPKTEDAPEAPKPAASANP